MIQFDTFIAPGAQIIGNVTIGSGASIWYGSVLRADINTITVGKYSNIQDGSILHVSRRDPVTVEDYVSIGHRAVVHGAWVKSGVLVGIGAVILDGAEIGEDSIIGAGALVPPGMKIPPRSLVLGLPGKVIRPVSSEEIESNRERAWRYFQLWQEKYKGKK